mgnify:CR=1 FL=1
MGLKNKIIINHIYQFIKKVFIFFIVLFIFCLLISFFNSFTEYDCKISRIIYNNKKEKNLFYIDNSKSINISKIFFARFSYFFLLSTKSLTKD